MGAGDGRGLAQRSGGLACRRAQIDRGAEILRVELAGRCHAQNARCRDQGEADLRASVPATQGRTRPRPLRRKILDRITPTCLDDDDRLCLPSVPPPQGCGTEKKSRGPAATTHHASDRTGHPQPFRTTSNPTILTLRKVAYRSSRSKSAKVVLVPLHTFRSINSGVPK